MGALRVGIGDVHRFHGVHESVHVPGSPVDRCLQRRPAESPAFVCDTSGIRVAWKPIRCWVIALDLPGSECYMLWKRGLQRSRFRCMKAGMSA